MGYAPAVYPASLESKIGNCIYINLVCYKDNIVGKPAVDPKNIRSTVFTYILPAPDNQIGITDSHSWEDLKSGMAQGVTPWMLTKAAEGLKAAGGAAANFAEKASGKFINDMSSIMYAGSAFKTLELGWTFTPESFEDAMLLAEIINEIRKNSYPAGLITDVTQDYPSLFKIEIYYGTKLLTTYLDCAVETLSVNYSGGPDGALSMFKAGYPLITNFNVTFKQIFKNTQQTIDSFINFKF